MTPPFQGRRNYHVPVFNGNISDVEIIRLADRLLSFSQGAHQPAFIIVHRHRGEEQV